MLTFVKYFYPLQMQQTIGENMNFLKSAMNDQGYLKYARTRYRQLKDAIDAQKAEMIGKADKDTTDHLEELNKYFDRTSEWQFKVKIDPKTDLVGDLFERYMADLLNRHRVSLESRDSICGLLRKSVDYNSINE